MMYASSSVGSMVWLCIHWLFMSVALFGFIAALLWLYKHAKKNDFWNVVWITLLVGTLGSLLTASLAMSGWNQMMGFHNGYSWDDDDREEMWEEMQDYFDETVDVQGEDFDMDDMMDEMMDFNDEE